MSKSTKILISFVVLVLLLLSSQGQCQTTKLCPQVDSLYEKWAFVNCQTQQQVLPYVYVQVENGNYDNWGSWNNDQCPYFWSKFSVDSLSIVDSLGIVMFKVSKQKFPVIEQIKFVNDEFFQFLWTYTTQVSYFSEDFNMSMFIDKIGNEFKPNNMTNISVREINKIGLNYIVTFRRLRKKKDEAFSKCVLIDKQGNSLSRVYENMQLAMNNELIEVSNNGVGFIDLTGKLVIPVKFNYNYYSGYANEFIILHKKNKYGVLDKKGKTILPFKYHNLRQIGNTLFVAQDNDNIGSEYVINTEKKILTKPIFCAISSFKNDTVYQNWNKTALAYNANGECISSKEEQEQKELFMLFIKETKTQKLYQLKNLSKVKSDEVELVFISPNHYQYKSQAAILLYVRRWYNRPAVIDKINFSTGKHFKYVDFPLQITEIQMLNTQTSEKTALKGSWEYKFNKEW